jgi:3-phosphoshikimate 1-carboxyvinyltransferase
MRSITILPCTDLFGSIDIPGDKSISHRALMFASIAEGTSTIENLLEGHDCIATLQVMRGLGVHIELSGSTWLVHGRGRYGLLEPESVLDCKNSGTTIRLMAGLMSAMPFMTILDGTDQIKRRPMDRVIEPLASMQARIYGRSRNTLAPIVTLPSTLLGINYELLHKSAQVKSAIILAALFAKQKTRISNTYATRDHTERLLKHMGADIITGDDFVEINPKNEELWPLSLNVPGDISSAAFMIVAALMLAKKGVVLRRVGVNPTRTGIIDALQAMGASIELVNSRTVANEPIADIHVKKSDLQGARFKGDHIVRMIDEIPILALAATQANGTTVIEDAHELRVKESNRIQKTVECLKALGANIEETHDGMIIRGPTALHGSEMVSFGDHRLALFLCIAGLVADGQTTVVNAEVINDSYPGFLESLNSLGAKTLVSQ